MWHPDAFATIALVSCQLPQPVPRMEMSLGYLPLANRKKKLVKKSKWMRLIPLSPFFVWANGTSAALFHQEILIYSRYPCLLTCGCATINTQFFWSHFPSRLYMTLFPISHFLFAFFLWFYLSLFSWQHCCNSHRVFLSIIYHLPLSIPNYNPHVHTLARASTHIECLLSSFTFSPCPPFIEPTDGDIHGRLPALPPEYSRGHLVPAPYLDCWHCWNLGVPGYCWLVLLLCEYSSTQTYMTHPFALTIFYPF